jgi:hypothetical protein
MNIFLYFVNGKLEMFSLADASVRPPRLRGASQIRADASVRLKAKKGMQSLVAENFM